MFLIRRKNNLFLIAVYFLTQLNGNEGEEYLMLSILACKMNVYINFN